MDNKYIKELEKLNLELSEMSDEEIFALFDGIDYPTEESKNFATLENYIINSKPNPNLKK